MPGHRARRFLPFACTLVVLTACSGGSSATCDSGTCGDSGPSRVSGTPTDGGCSATFTGQYSETDYSTGCCLVQKNSLGGDTLICTFAANLTVVNNQLQVGLGTEPQAGEWSSDLTTDWTMTSYSYSNNPANCSWAAAPGGPGDFTVNLTTLDDPYDGGPVVVHGTVHIDEATSTIDPNASDGCGANTEALDATF
ncbi:MAG: hypothetical protein JST54_24485 [Deltaproteobacteria bacterium]|nr:hypothetical protein [Deltaproteobacteria bacterium]